MPGHAAVHPQTDKQNRICKLEVFLLMDIPVEIVRIIVEEAARLSPSVAVKVLRLSSVTKVWIAPILYRTVTLRTYSQFASFRLAMDHEGMHNPGMYVRQLYLLLVRPRRLSDSDLRAVFTKCPNLVHCAFTDPNLTHRFNETSDIALQRSIKRLSFCTWRYPLGSFSRHLIHLTHLHVVCPSHSFYNLLDFNSGHEFPNILSVVMEIMEPSGIHQVIYPADASLAALANGMSSLLKFLQKATNIQELVLKLQVSSSAFLGALASVEQLMKDPRVRMTHEPFDELSQRPEEQPGTVYTNFKDRLCRALIEVNELWQNV